VHRYPRCVSALQRNTRKSSAGRSRSAFIPLLPGRRIWSCPVPRLTRQGPGMLRAGSWERV
jgi:hypothetical protein